MNLVKCKAVLFDLDGTLVDSGLCIEHLWSHWADKNHINVEYVLSNIHGRTIEETLKLISPYFDNSKCADEIKKLALKELNHIKSIPGAVAFMKKLPMNYLAIVTSGAKQVSMQSIISAGIPIPDVMITAEDITHGKPDPEPYLKAAKFLGVQPNECLVFEDANSGIQSALAAGMRIIAIGKNSDLALREGIMSIENYENIDAKIEKKFICLSW